MTSSELSRGRQFALGTLAARYGIFLSFVVLFIILSFSNQYFLTSLNIINVLRQVSINGILAVGMTFVILTGGIDLSIGSILALAGMVAASLVTGDDALNPLLAIAAALAIGTGVGAVNGLAAARFNVPPFVITLAMLSVARGATLLYSGGKPIANLSAGYRYLGGGVVLGVPVPVLIFAVVFLAAWITLRYSVYGRYVYAVGGNIRSARTSGIATVKIIFSVYTLMGALAGLAGLVLTARTTAAVPQAGLGYELDAIAAVVIGGTSLAGGVGSIVNTLVGVLIIGIISNGLDLMGVSSYYQQIVKGVIIVVAVMIDRSRERTV